VGTGTEAVMPDDSLRYWCFRCKRVLVNDPALKTKNRNDTVTYLEDMHEIRHDGCDGIVSMSRREAQTR
jgi:hypothetical protein